MQDFDFIETPENVELERRLAGIGTRFVAGLLDNLLIAAIFLTLFILFLFLGVNMFTGGFWSDAVDTWIFALLILLAGLIYWGYFVFFELGTNGQSPGKKYMKIRVVQKEGAGITFSSIAVRNLLRVVDSLGFYIVAGISMFFSSKVQRLGDLAAGTVVVSEELPNYAATGDQKRQVLDEDLPSAEVLGSSQLKPEEYRLLNNYWLRRHELSIEARQRLLPQLVRPVMTRLGDRLESESLAAMETYVAQLLGKMLPNTAGLLRPVNREETEE